MREAALRSDEDFTVDGRCSRPGRVRSFRPRDEEPPTLPAAQISRSTFAGRRRTNDTHQSSTDPNVRLYKKARGQPAQLAYSGHVLMEHRSGLIVDTRLTPADGHRERDAALLMVEAIPGRPRMTVAADKAYDTRDFMTNLRVMDATPHVAQFATRLRRGSAIDRRTMRHGGYVAKASANSSSNALADEDGRRPARTRTLLQVARAVHLCFHGGGGQHRPVAPPAAGPCVSNALPQPRTPTNPWPIPSAAPRLREA
jgi:hypothetical protein